MLPVKLALVIDNVGASLASLTRAVGETVGAYAITGSTLSLSGTAASNYNNISALSSPSSLTIIKANLTGTIANQTKVFGTSDPTPSSINVILDNIVNNPAIVTWNGNVSVNDTGKVSTTLASYTRVQGETTVSSPYAITSATFNPLVGSAASNYNGPTSLNGNPILSITPAVAPTPIPKIIPSIGGIIFPTNYNQTSIASTNINNPLINNKVGVGPEGAGFGLEGEGARAGVVANGLIVATGKVTGLTGNIINQPYTSLAKISNTPVMSIANVKELIVNNKEDLLFAILLAALGIAMVLVARQRNKLDAIQAIELSRNSTAISPSDYDLPTVSFKLRSALNTIIGFTVLIKDEQGQVSPLQKKFLEYITSESNEIMLNLENSESNNNLQLDTGLLANISFKLRTSLNSIIGYASLIQNGQVGKISDKQKEFLGEIMSGSDDIMQLIPAD